MNQLEKDVREFMLLAEQECPEKPIIPKTEIINLRCFLMLEELKETLGAMNREISENSCMLYLRFPYDNENTQDIIEFYDGLIDLLVVTIGTLVAFGLPLQEGWEEVKRSNLSKFIDGYKREDGKWMKGPSFVKPNLEKILDALKTN